MTLLVFDTGAKKRVKLQKLCDKKKRRKKKHPNVRSFWIIYYYTKEAERDYSNAEGGLENDILKTVWNFQLYILYFYKSKCSAYDYSGRIVFMR